MQIEVLKDFDNRPDFVGVAWKDDEYAYHIWLNQETLVPTHGFVRPIRAKGIDGIPRRFDIDAHKPMVDEAIAAFVELAIS